MAAALGLYLYAAQFAVTAAHVVLAAGNAATYGLLSVLIGCHNQNPPFRWSLLLLPEKEDRFTPNYGFFNYARNAYFSSPCFLNQASKAMLTAANMAAHSAMYTAAPMYSAASSAYSSAGIANIAIEPNMASITDIPLFTAAVSFIQSNLWNFRFSATPKYAVNTMNESALTLSEKGPAKRQEAQEHYDYEIEAAKERFQEKLDAWQVQAAAAEAAGKQPPDKPQEPKFKPRPEDYPVEIYEMVKTAWDAGDPSQSAQRKAIEESEKPHEFAIDFNVNF